MAAQNPTKSPPRKRRARRRVLWLLIPALGLVVGWKVAERYIDIERYRPVIDKELELLIELPLSFGAMDLQLFPTPRLVVENVALGEDDFMAFSPRVEVTADLGKLIHRELDLRTVAIHDVRVQLPAATADLQARWSAYMLALETPDPSTGKPMLKVTLETITAKGAQVFRGEDLYATGALDVAGVTAGAPVFTFSLEGDGVDGRPSTEGAFTLTVNSEPLLAGSARVSKLPLANLTDDHGIPPFLLDGQIDFSQAQDSTWTLGADGDIGLVDRTEGLGTYAIAARYGNGTLTFDSLGIATTPLDFSGNLSLLGDGRWTLVIDRAVLRDEGIDWLAERIPEVPFVDNPTVPSEGALTAMRMGDETGAGFSIKEGTIAVAGVDLGLGSSFALPEVTGLGTVSGGTIEIAALAGRHFDVLGTVETDFSNDTITVTLGGLLQLAPDFPLPESVAEAFRPEAGTVDIQSIGATFKGGALQFASLQVDAQIENVLVSAWDDATATFLSAPAVSGNIAVREGAIQLTELTGAGSMLSATLTPDEALERWAFRADLESDLASPLWKPLVPGAVATVRGGHLTTTTLSGVFSPGSFHPEALEVAATIQEFSADVHGSGYEDTLRFDSVELTATNDRLEAKLSGATERFGPLRAEGAYDLPTGNIVGDLTLNPERASGIPASLREGVAGVLLAKMSPLPLAIEYTRASGLLQFSTDEPTPFSGTLSFPDHEDAVAPLGFAAAASVPASWIAAPYSDVSVVGNIEVQCQMTASDGALAFKADGLNTALGWSVFQKRIGSPLSLTLSGQWGNDGLTVAGGELLGAGQEISFTMGSDGVESEHFQLALAKLTPLLPAGCTLSGSVEGRFAKGLDDLDLVIQGLAFTPAPGAPALGATGSLRRRGETWTVANLDWTAGTSSGVADLTYRNGSWTGDLHARLLDLGALPEVYDGITALSEPAPPSETRESALFSGSIRVRADELRWAGATVAQARCTLEGSGDRLDVRGFTFVYGTGTGGGRFNYRPGRGGAAPMVTAELELRQIDAKLIEGIFMEEARGLEGTLDGSATLDFPLPPEGISVLNGMNGRIVFEATDGTLGKAGLATKLLTSLRTTDVLRLRIPLLRDRGLTFKELSGEIAIEAGVFHVAPYAMADSTYVLEADGRFDFPQDTATGDVQVQVLEGVTGVVGKIPILGEAANLMNKVFSIPIKITGTASDPGFRVGMPG